MQIWIVLTSLESLWQRPNFLPYEHGKTGGRDESRLSRINRVRILLIFQDRKKLQILHSEVGGIDYLGDLYKLSINISCTGPAVNVKE